ncbi:ABC transporter permease [Candidatus Thorarchaeota archaeon]|nr:MAG: ABC transporter permease [Candidatus Thorarchaeota archaeon]
MQTKDTSVSEEIDDHQSNMTSDYLMDFQPRMMDWNAAKIFAVKNLRIAIRYPTNVLIWGLLPILWLAPYLLMMTAVAGPGTSEYFAEVSGFDDFLKFAVIGWFIFKYIDASIWAIGNNFRWEQFSGTLEPLFVTPVPRISILLGAAFSDTVQTTLSAFILLFTAMALFGVTYTFVAIGPMILIMLLMIIAFYGFGFMLAGMILVFKDPSVLTELINNAVFTVSPITYPLQVLPVPARFAAYLIPSTIAIVVVRELAITGTYDLFQFLQSVGFMCGMIVFFWALGIAVFNYGEKWTKDRGSMGGF